MISYRLSAEPYSEIIAEKYLETDFLPARIVALHEPYALVLWQDGNYRSVVTVTYTELSILTNYDKAENVKGRDINSDLNKMPFTAESDPRLAILYGENKIEILRSSTFQQEQVMTIE